MADPRIHAIMTRYPAGFSVSSPQLPELVAGFDTEEELEGELLSLLIFGGAPQEYQLVRHYQEFSSNEGREWFVRLVHDQKLKERAVTFHLFLTLIRVTPEPLDAATKSTTGEATFVVALPEDTVGWLAEQMTEKGCALTVVVRDGSGLTTFDLLTEDLNPGPQFKVDPAVTVAEVLGMVERSERYVPGLDFLSGEPVGKLSSSKTLVSI